MAAMNTTVANTTALNKEVLRRYLGLPQPENTVIAT
jgi:hypothetical protein